MRKRSEAALPLAAYSETLFRMDIHHIVVAVDFSPASRSALREAGRLAAQWKAGLTGLHVIEEDTAETFEKKLHGDLTALKQALAHQLRHWMHHEVAPEVTTNVRLAVGQPSRDLWSEFQKIGGDLLVLGARGHTHNEHRLGAIAASFVRQAEAPVFLVSQNAGRPTEVVACIDYSEVSPKVMERAIELARTDRVPLEVIHCVPPIFQYYTDIAIASGLEPFTTAGVDPAHLEQLEQDHEIQMKRFVEDFQPKLEGVDVSTRILHHPSPARAVLEYLESKENPLAVLGAHGRTGLREALLGTTAERILHGAKCSALVVREPRSTSPNG